MSYSIFQVTQSNSWSCPGMLIFVSPSGAIIGQQSNPDNGLTIDWAEDGTNWGHFNPSDYLSVKQVG